MINHNSSDIVLKSLKQIPKDISFKLFICNDQKEAEQLQADLSFFIGKDVDIDVFPDWEILPYDHFSPHQDIISHRLSLLYKLLQKQPMILIASISTLLYRLCPEAFLKQGAFIIEVQQLLPLIDFKAKLIDSQYRLVSEVHEHGDLALRGALMDIFPMGSDFPIRVEWFDDEISSIRKFNLQTQLTTEKIQQLYILPNKEFVFDEKARSLFRQQFRQEFTNNYHSCAVYENVSSGQLQQGLENYLPLFFETTASIFDYLPKNTHIIFHSNILEKALRFWEEIDNRYQQRCHDIFVPILKPEKLFFDPNSWHEKLLTFSHQILSANEPRQTLPNLKIERQKSKPLHRLFDYIVNNPTQRLLILAASVGKREVFNDLCSSSDIFPKVFSSFKHFIDSDCRLGLIHGPFTQQMFFTDLNLQCLTEFEFFGEYIIYQKESLSQKTTSNTEKLIKDLSELHIGMPVVHIDFGIGRYEGLHTFEHQGIVNEFLMITYAGNDKIYVPITHLQTISKYTGLHSDNVTLHRLGSGAWQKEKKKAAEKVYDVAIELLETQAIRDAQQGFTCQLDLGEYERFVSGFRFDETVDQSHSIAAILEDLQSTKPMDRLICGDVGFGKTEVAMRAAFVMVQNHRQVCVLVPTTLLAQQHFETFQERFADFPFSIELLSRFRSKKESENVLEKSQQGKIDILIGTHKLLQQDLKFHELGLLIIDEEHRFGVKQKEYIKKIRHHADILSLTATPIPRTLNMAMHGMRDISLITTPPPKRLAIKTFWNEKNNTDIREAILREVFRGGQVYYLNNDISSMEKICEELRKLIPEAKIEFAHGQMNKRRLEQIMADFYHQRFNVLICSTIIETGLDIPTANTIVIERADKLGLAQMHQLRGRVGRSHHQAYCYLLTPPKDSLASDSVKRLEAIISLENLGAGFSLAMLDMEIRGAGEILGEVQSGNIHSVGFSLYMEMLEQAIEDIKAGRIPNFEHRQHLCEMDLKICAIIPENYIPDVHQRLVFYKRLSNAKDSDELRQLQIELIDRFGLLPEPVKNLVESILLKQSCDEMGISKLHLSPNLGVIEFHPNPKIEPLEIIHLIQQQPQIYKLIQEQRLQFKLNESDSVAHKINFVGDLIKKIKKQES